MHTLENISQKDFNSLKRLINTSKEFTLDNIFTRRRSSKSQGYKSHRLDLSKETIFKIGLVLAQILESRKQSSVIEWVKDNVSQWGNYNSSYSSRVHLVYRYGQIQLRYYAGQSCTDEQRYFRQEIYKTH